MSASIFDLQGKTAVVVGGTTGIGHALSLGLADAGADVVASSRRPEQVEQTAAQIEAKGRKTLRRTSDVHDRATLEALRDEVLGAFGKVDILINCAGITKRAPTLDFPEADWDQIIDTNLTGTLRGCQVFGKHMLSRGYGRIINIASLSTYVGLFEVAAYSASKAAVGALTKVLAVEWSRHGVLVNAIAPGRIPHRPKRKSAGQYGARTGIQDAYSHWPLWQNGRAGGCGRVPGLGCSIVCIGRDTGGRRRLSGQRSQSIAMEYRKLGQTDLNLSVVGFGSATLGDVFGNVDPSEAIRAVHLAVDSGINFFDSSPYYGITLAETRLGEALAGRRDRVVLATKCGRYGFDEFDFSAKRVIASIDESLRRLQTDYIDLFQAHDVEFGDVQQIIHETLPALRQLQQQGKARYIGITGYPPKLSEAHRRGYAGR